MDEATLVRRAKDGDVDAYQQLVRCHQAVAFRVAVLIVGNTADARDAANDAVVKAFYALGRFRADAPFRPWLLRIVANEARNSRRSAGRRAHLAGRVGSADVAPSPEEAVMATLEYQALFDAIGRLDHRDREVISLRFLAELSEAETAAALGCAPGTAKSRLHRALERLRLTMLSHAQIEARSPSESRATDA